MFQNTNYDALTYGFSNKQNAGVSARTIANIIERIDVIFVCGYLDKVWITC